MREGPPKGGDFQIKRRFFGCFFFSPLLPLLSGRVSEDTDAAEPTRQLCFISAPERLSLQAVAPSASARLCSVTNVEIEIEK